MARGGINKALVKEACTALLQRGRRPSIDAVRIELGNTGSKTTIARYLKEIQAVPSSAVLSPQERVSAPLLAVVASLSEQLAQEAEVTLIHEREQFAAERTDLRTNLSQRTRELEQAQMQIHDVAAELAQARAQNETLCTQLVAEQQLTATLQAKVQELRTQLAEKQNQLQTLNETSAHARESLLHFREASKEQRDTLLHQHEQQVQQVEQQLRAVARILDSKQDDVVGLSRDNERLTSELVASRKQTQHEERQVDQLTQQLAERGHAQDQINARLIRLSSQLERATARNDVLQQTHTSTLLENERLQQRLLELEARQP
ncbi:chromosome segregation ATPase [Pseudomonas frederiksbergensis]|uniref:DNA-binding protein n=1 Tax=Pseudomonas frederiksbergensis TaxID=104087 RepID=UPI003D2105C7